uniref:Rnh202 triple barrel domain-containing protein n=1 Tax=Globisporangium ultimum (strain ATCC 200006 / CBS 805.95 / DAOM BR144) TaxID=431595 RepID=K3WRE3_GLOUD
MGKKALAVVPALKADAKLGRFHGDATDKPLYTVVTWSTSPQENAAAATSPQARKRQLAIVGATKLLEMQRLQAPADARSWFIGNDVQQDGSLMVLTPLDPLFVLLMSTWRQKERFMALYELFSHGQNTWWLQLAACNQAKIETICEVQCAGDDDTLDNLFVKANVVKILQWLRAKVTRVATTLAKQAAENAKQSNSGFDANFVLPGVPAATAEPVVSEAPMIDATKFHRDAIELIADYLPEDVTDLLYQQFNLKKEVPAAPQSVASAANPHESFQRFDRRLQSETSAAASSNKRTPPSVAAATKKKSKLANVDRSGMKSLTSFFTKK